MSDNGDIIQIEKMSADQFAGAVVLILGAVGSLLLVVWQSKCHCRVNLCYICQCERKPPNEEEMKTLADETKALKNKQNKINKSQMRIAKKEDEILMKEEEILDEVIIPPTPKPRPEVSNARPEKKTNVELTIEEEMELDPLKVLDSNRELTKEEKEKEKMNSLV